MRYIFRAIAMLFWVLVSGSAFSQEPVMVMNSPELGAHQRPLVSFPHERHMADIQCSRCHHEYDLFGANINGDEGRKCADCHTKKAGTNPVSLSTAFHKQCKTCHVKLSAQGHPKVPVMCGRCHVRVPQASQP